MGLDALLVMPRGDLLRFVQAADGRPADVGVRVANGALLHASVCASSSAGAAAAPCVLVVIREAPEHARALDEVDRIRGVLSDALDALERISEQRRDAAPPASADHEPTTDAPAPHLPDLTLAQYVALSVESELQPARIREINERYGLLSDNARGLLDRAFRERLAADPALETERAALHARYLFWFHTQGRAHQESGAPAAPAVSLSTPPKLPKPLPAPTDFRATARSPGVSPPAARRAKAAAAAPGTARPAAAGDAAPGRATGGHGRARDHRHGGRPLRGRGAPVQAGRRPRDERGPVHRAHRRAGGVSGSAGRGAGPVRD